MAVHKLILGDIFENTSCTLIALHCTIEDYRLAYLLNKNLNIGLIRKAQDLDFNDGQSSYSIYEWEDKKQLITWHLVSNISRTESLSNIDHQSLFNTRQQVIKTHHLIPEYRRVNYFLKMDSELNGNREKHIINNLLKISHIATAYAIDINQLKSKENLIFN